MEIQKAIEWIRAISATQSNSTHKNSLSERKEALHMAILALKKQAPTKCVKDDCERDCCPVCGWIIGYGDTIQPHCHNCGQSLDWGDAD